MTRSIDLVGVGGIAVDLVLGVTDLARMRGKFSCEFIGRLPGGLIANATVAAARLGLRTAFAGQVGDDENGEFLRAALRTHGIDTGALETARGPTPFTVVMLEHGGERAIALPRFDNDEDELSPRQRQLLGQSHAALTTPRNRVWLEHILESLSGGALILDIEEDCKLPARVLAPAIERARICFVSAATLERLGADALTQLPGEGWKILTDGAAGARAVAGRGAPELRQPAFATQVLDTTGAGDCFHAALSFAWLRGEQLPEALRFASAAAAIKVRTLGAQNGLPDEAEVSGLLSGERD